MQFVPTLLRHISELLMTANVSLTGIPSRSRKDGSKCATCGLKVLVYGGC
jgi:hypothetical protein